MNKKFSLTLILPSGVDDSFFSLVDWLLEVGTLENKITQAEGCV